MTEFILDSHKLNINSTKTDDREIHSKTIQDRNESQTITLK